MIYSYNSWNFYFKKESAADADEHALISNVKSVDTRSNTPFIECFFLEGKQLAVLALSPETLTSYIQSQHW